MAKSSKKLPLRGNFFTALEADFQLIGQNYHSDTALEAVF